MPKIREDIVRQILDRAKIEEVVGDFLRLRRTGIRYTVTCPFHDDRHDGNFIVYPKGNCYRCFTCDAKGGVVDFLMKHGKMTYPDALRWLGRKYNVETDNVPFDYTPPPAPPTPPPLPMLELPMRMVTAREQTQDDTLCQWIRTGIRWNKAQHARIEPTLAAYHIGHARQGHTIFWQIDEQGRVRTGKMMRYKPDGHRDRQTPYSFDWIHSALYRHHTDGLSGETSEPQQCLFGLHLLNQQWCNAAVCIVESEKTALLMAIAYGNHAQQVWMACGGLSSLTRQRLQPIIQQRRRIILYPDRDGIKAWQQKAESLHYDRLSVDARPVSQWWTEDDGPKADIADVVIRMINTAPPPLKTTGEVIETMPQAKGLIEKLDLEIVNEEMYDRQPREQ